MSDLSSDNSGNEAKAILSETADVESGGMEGGKSGGESGSKRRDQAERRQHDKSDPAAAQLARAVSGVIGVAVGLTFAEIVAAATDRVPSLVIAMGDWMIDSTWVPAGVRNWSIEQLGSAQKPALVAGIVVVSLLLGAVSGWLSRKFYWLPALVMAAFGSISGLVATYSPMTSDAWAVVTAGFAAALGLASMYYLLSLVPVGVAAAAAGVGADGMADGAAVGEMSAKDLRKTKAVREDRRRFVLVAGASSLGLVFTNIITRAVASQVDLTESQDQVRGLLSGTTVPSGGSPATPADGSGGTADGTDGANGTPTADADEGGTSSTTTTTAPENLQPNLDAVDGISPLITPTADFYRIDTALVVPRVTIDSWRLAVTGMVDNPLELTIEQLLSDYPVITEPVTLSCVSNPIGGSLVGNAVWQGVRLSDVLEDAGVQPGASQISGVSVDNWKSGFPTELAFDGRVAMIAVAMNDEPLPARHGFPARLVVSGLYGYVSATKWLREIYLTTWEGFDSFWVQHNWSKEGPIKTQSRIDVPQGNNDLVNVGERVALAGVAWAPNKSIIKVEVSAAPAGTAIDEREWIEAELSQELSTNSWRQWVHYWVPQEAGRHNIIVRATDGTGETQTSARTNPKPNGASGWHAKAIRVAAA